MMCVEGLYHVMCGGVYRMMCGGGLLYDVAGVYHSPSWRRGGHHMMCGGVSHGVEGVCQMIYSSTSLSGLMSTRLVDRWQRRLAGIVSCLE